jgi:hypothetical protein
MDCFGVTLLAMTAGKHNHLLKGHALFYRASNE